MRLGLRYVRGLRKAAGERDRGRARGARPFASLQDLVDRAALHRDELTALAEVGRAERLRPHAAQRAVAGGARGAAAGPAVARTPTTAPDALAAAAR